MTTPKLNSPCRECPWKRTSAPGWLGSSTPEEFVSAQQTHDMPCHMTVDYEDPCWELQLDDAASCHGGLQFMKNSAVLPLDREMRARRDAAGPSDSVFSNGREFIDHHRSLGMGSWEF